MNDGGKGGNGQLQQAVRARGPITVHQGKGRAVRRVHALPEEWRMFVPTTRPIS